MRNRGQRRTKTTRQRRVQEGLGLIDEENSLG